ncbi:hypothetical protein [Francisella sp. 19X1-34]|uniref:hypothetical protein n=1 Tax=Francisella sp. 19X1-34 TaxID=3087177 RepID=UPI002E313272|nr:hypothetical protein [Francisella sp. 19X1-34]MED7787764.1 hypothetical protein [Francisella sp. 19X1-34]
MFKFKGISLQVLLFLVSLSVASASNTMNLIKVKESGIKSIAIEDGKKHEVFFYKKTPYALCSKALCTWKNGEKATCFCPIIYPEKLQKEDAWMGASLSPYDSEKTSSTYKNDRITTVVSTFSLANIISIGKISACPAKDDLEYSWADCFGVRCDVTQNPSVADCKCPIKKSKDYISMGVKSENLCFTGKPNPKGYSFGWSAESLKMGSRDQDILISFYKKYFPGTPPTKVDFKK